MAGKASEDGQDGTTVVMNSSVWFFTYSRHCLPAHAARSASHRTVTPMYITTAPRCSRGPLGSQHPVFVAKAAAPGRKAYLARG